MSIKLSTAEEHALSVKIAEGLEGTRFRHGFVYFQDLKWASEISNDLPEDARNKIDRHVGEDGLARLIASEISARLDRTEPHIVLKEGSPASDIPFLRNPLTFARDFTKLLRQLPLRYRVTVALPSLYSHFISNDAPECFPLPHGTVLAFKSGLPGDLPVHSPNARVDSSLFNDFIVSEEVNRQIRDDLIYLSLPLNGYAYASGSSALARQAEDHLRAFYGASMALNMIEYGWKHASLGTENRYIMIHDERTRELVATEPQEEDLWSNRLHCSTSAFADRHKGDLARAYNIMLTKISAIFNENIDCRKLFSACIWYYRAKMNRRPLDALLEATIAIEVMLGDRRASEGIGLTNLLESRCAYLLGRSLDSRAKIAADFRKVYELRSQVVHEGRHVPRTGDRQVVQTGLRLCAQIITTELAIRGKAS